MKLYKYVEQPVQKATDHHDRGHYEELSPADLAKMNLAALRVLGELKKDIQRQKDEADITSEWWRRIRWFENRIADLESAADLKGPEIQIITKVLFKELEVQAKAWGLVSSNLTNMGLAWEVKEYLDKAQAELALPSGRAKEKGDKPNDE